MPISRNNPGRSFEVIQQQVGHWVRGNIFTEYDFRRLNPAPTPNAGDDPVTATNDYYEELYDRLLRMTPPAIRIIHMPSFAIDPNREQDGVGATFATGADPVSAMADTPIFRELTKALADGLQANVNKTTSAKMPPLKKSNWRYLRWLWLGPHMFWAYIVEHKVWSRVVGSLITAVILIWLAHHYAWFNSKH